MRAVQVASAGADFELVERDRPEPARGQVLVRVNACGVCHSDAMTRGGLASAYPRVPGHEVVGMIDAVGPGAPGPLRYPPSRLSRTVRAAATMLRREASTSG